MRVPPVGEAERYLDDAAARNPGPWVQHSRYVGRAAQAIAARHPALEAEVAYVLGLLHDIGRQAGVTAMRHTLDGYTFLADAGYPDAARVCLTHSFPPPLVDVHSAAGEWDCSAAELRFVADFVAGAPPGPYDRLIQLCDALALPSGFCLLEQRFVDVVLRHGFTDHTTARWRAYLRLRAEFDAAVGGSVYHLLPGLAEHILGGPAPPLPGSATRRPPDGPRSA
jgi:hypothetical protein